MKDWIIRHRMPVFWALAALVHLGAFLWIRFQIPDETAGDEERYEIFKLVDIEEYTPPPPPPPDVPVTTVVNQSKAAEQIVETENIVLEDKAGSTPQLEPEYLPQHKISVIPAIPSAAILDRIIYPPVALRQGIEGIVYLELFIDETGQIRKIEVLRDPGYGFAEAAISALNGIVCSPAMANGTPVPVRFRYPVRFTLK